MLSALFNRFHSHIIEANRPCSGETECKGFSFLCTVLS